MAVYEQNRDYWDRLRENSMVSIALENGCHLFQSGIATGKTRLFRSPWREDKNPSLKINEQTHEWVDYGDTDSDHIKKNRDGSKKSHAGGDTIDFVSVIKFGKVYPYLSSNEKNEVRKYLESRSPGLFRLQHSAPLADYVNHSSAAAAVPSWERYGRKYGMRVNRYYYNEEKPTGNKEISEKEYQECVERVWKANETLSRHPERLLPVLSRYWMQVKHADAVFIVSRFIPGESGILEGGAAWAAQMAFDASKPVYLFEDDAKKWYVHSPGQDPGQEVKPGWAEYEGTPVLTRSFAGFGSKLMTADGEEAIRGCFRETLRLYGVEFKAGDEKTPKAEAAKDPAVKEEVFTISESSNAVLSVLAERPFTVGPNHFHSVEHFVQWSKAQLAADEDAMQRILCVEDPLMARQIGDGIQLKDAEEWEAKLPSIVEYALVQSFFSNPDSAYKLLCSGNARLSAVEVRYPFLSESLTALRQMLFDSCCGNINQYRSNRHWVVDSARPGLNPSRAPGRDRTAAREDFRVVANLLEYMRDERCIPERILDRYCYEVKAHIEYEEDGAVVKEKPVYAVGFLNSVGGYELRKENFVGRDGKTRSGMKVCTVKAATLICSDGRKVVVVDDPKPYDEVRDVVAVPSFDAYLDSADRKGCWVFEGFTDFLSSLAWSRSDTPPVDCIIINSTSGARAMLPVMSRYAKVTCFLDNDESGRNTTKMIRDELSRSAPGCTVVDGMEGNEFFAGYNDINEAWQANVRGVDMDESPGIGDM